MAAGFWELSVDWGIKSVRRRQCCLADLTLKALMQRTLSSDEIAARKEKRARQAQENAVRYQQEQQAMLDKTARLRALRLSRERPQDEQGKQPAAPKESAERRPLADLHQGARG